MQLCTTKPTDTAHPEPEDTVMTKDIHQTLNHEENQPIQQQISTSKAYYPEFRLLTISSGGKSVNSAAVLEQSHEASFHHTSADYQGLEVIQAIKVQLFASADAINTALCSTGLSKLGPGGPVSNRV